MGAPSPEHVHALGSKFSQLLADTILNAAPHVQQHVQDARAAANHDFLEGMEQHVADLIGPMLTSYTQSGEVPLELSKLLEELGVPTEQFTGIISQFFIFGVMFTLAQAMLAPFVQQVQNDVWAAHPTRPLSPPDIATAVVRGISYGNSEGTAVADWALAEAAKSGLDPEVFKTMVGVTGMAPSLQLLYEMIRRGIIEEGTLNGGGTTLVSGIQQSDIKDEWIPSVAKLRYVQPTPVDMVRAAVQDQWDETPTNVDYALQKEWALKLGLEPAGWDANNPDWFNILVNTAGRPPGPETMARAANRGLTDWSSRGSSSISFSQAISESDVKNKYIPLLEKLAVYWPPSGEVGSLLKEGGLNVAQAEAYWKANGVPAELAKAFLYVAQIQQVTQDKALAKGDILTLVQEGAIDDADALEMLEEIGYSGANANALLAMAHFRFELGALRESVRTVSQMFTTRKITATQAKEALQGFGIPESQINKLLDTLTYEMEALRVIPTPAQIAGALYYKIIDQATAMNYLEQHGYDPVSAYIVLSDRMHGPLPNPPAGFTPPGAASVVTTSATVTPPSPSGTVGP